MENAYREMIRPFAFKRLRKGHIKRKYKASARTIFVHSVHATIFCTFSIKRVFLFINVFFPAVGGKLEGNSEKKTDGELEKER